MNNPYAPGAGFDTLNCIAGIIGLIIAIAVASYVYSKAEEYGQSGCLWAIFGFLFPLPTIIVFLIVNSGKGGQGRGRGRDEYYTASGVYGGKAAPPPPTASSTPDPDFRDDHLEELITDGRLGEARTYLREMIKMAREMSDMKGVRNYAQYEAKINKAAMSSTRRHREDE
jgi:hypothetical protein